MISRTLFKLKKNGSFQKCSICRTPELIENYDKAIADTTQIWECHHRLETHNSDGEKRLVDLSRAELIALEVYFDRSPEELIFLTRHNHNILHKKGKRLSEDIKEKISSSHRGICFMSEETKRRMSEERKGEKNACYGRKHSEEELKKMSEARKGRHWKLVNGKRIYF